MPAGRIAEDPANCAAIAQEEGAIQQLILMALSDNEVVVEQACKVIGGLVCDQVAPTMPAAAFLLATGNPAAEGCYAAAWGLAQESVAFWPSVCLRCKPEYFEPTLMYVVGLLCCLL